MAIAFSYTGFLWGWTLIIASALKSEMNDIHWYSVQIILKILLSMIIFPLLRKGLMIVFQIQDDYLDVYGNQDLFGKKVGGDIAENKKTFLLVKAQELAKGDDATTLQRALANKITN